MNYINLFCVPFAGGSADAIYGKWSSKLDSSIRIRPLEMAGHGRRMQEPFHPNIAAAVEDMISTMIPSFDKPYAIYAHSMGTLIAYEIVKYIHSKGLREPEILFLSGRHPPHYFKTKDHIHTYSDEEFIHYIEKIGGTQPEVLRTKELMDIFLPILRSDYFITDNYTFQEPIYRTNAEIVYLYSDNDFLIKKSCTEEWSYYTNNGFELYEFEGGHFFINDQWPMICQLINQKVRALYQSV